MSRMTMMLGGFLAASVGALAQTVVTQERPSNEPVQVGAIYNMSFCTKPEPTPVPEGTSYIRVVRELNRGWLEVERESSPDGFDPAFRAADPYRRGRPIEKFRLNLNSVCALTPVAR